LAGKTPEATRKQENNLQAAILAALRKRDGGAVVGEGSPAKWQLKEAAQAALDEKQYGDKCRYRGSGPNQPEHQKESFPVHQPTYGPNL
jgi:surface antigen